MFSPIYRRHKKTAGPPRTTLSPPPAGFPLCGMALLSPVSVTFHNCHNFLHIFSPGAQKRPAFQGRRCRHRHRRKGFHGMVWHYLDMFHLSLSPLVFRRPHGFPGMEWHYFTMFHYSCWFHYNFQAFFSHLGHKNGRPSKDAVVAAAAAAGPRQTACHPSSQDEHTSSGGTLLCASAGPSSPPSPPEAAIGCFFFPLFLEAYI